MGKTMRVTQGQCVPDIISTSSKMFLRHRFFSEFSCVTYSYLSACLFTSKIHLNTESKSLYYKAEALRAFFFFVVTHFTQP